MVKTLTYFPFNKINPNIHSSEVINKSVLTPRSFASWVLAGWESVCESFQGCLKIHCLESLNEQSDLVFWNKLLSWQDDFQHFSLFLVFTFVFVFMFVLGHCSLHSIISARWAL